jgi:hypothetical protein
MSAAATWAAWVDSGAATSGDDAGDGTAGRGTGGIAGSGIDVVAATGSGTTLVEVAGAPVTTGTGARRVGLGLARPDSTVPTR